MKTKVLVEVWPVTGKVEGGLPQPVSLPCDLIRAAEAAGWIVADDHPLSHLRWEGENLAAAPEYLDYCVCARYSGPQEGLANGRRIDSPAVTIGDGQVVIIADSLEEVRHVYGLLQQGGSLESITPLHSSPPARPLPRNTPAPRDSSGAIEESP